MRCGNGSAWMKRSGSSAAASFRSSSDTESEAARDEVCRAFADMYKKDADKFPSETREGTYQRRIKASYPIHPEVFSRLYEDWSSLPKFQRTRGVLRLMAKIVNSLWRSGNQDLLITPGVLPLDDLTVRNRAGEVPARRLGSDCGPRRRRIAR